MHSSAPVGEEEGGRGAPDLYATIGVRADADADTIRRAYYRKAMHTHPDRAGTSATAEFQRLQHAYEVLSDPVKRRAYDMHGEDGLRMVEGDHTPLMQSMGIKAVISLSSFSAAFVVCCLLAQFIVLTVKIDAEKDWRWATVLAPTWVFDAVTIITLLVVVIITLRNAIVDEELSRIRASHVFSALGVILGVASHVLIGVALETGAFGALIALSPALLVSIVGAIAVTPTSVNRRRTRDILHINTGVEPSGCTVVWSVINNVVSAFATPATLLLAGLRVDEYTGSAHYFVVWAPYCVHAFTSTISQWLVSGLLMEAKQVSMGHRVCALILELLRHATVIAGAILVAIKLQTQGAEPELLAVCLVPWFALLLYAGCALCFMGCLMADGANDDLTTLDQLQRQEEEMRQHDATAHAAAGGHPQAHHAQHSPATAPEV